MTILFYKLEQSTCIKFRLFVRLYELSEKQINSLKIFEMEHIFKSKYLLFVDNIKKNRIYSQILLSGTMNYSMFRIIYTII